MEYISLCSNEVIKSFQLNLKKGEKQLRGIAGTIIQATNPYCPILNFILTLQCTKTDSEGLQEHVLQP